MGLSVNAPQSAPMTGQPGSNQVVGQMFLPQSGLQNAQISQQPNGAGAINASKPGGAQSAAMAPSPSPPAPASQGMSYGAYTPQLGMLAQRTPVAPHTTMDANAALEPYLTGIQSAVNRTTLPTFNLGAGLPPLNQAPAPAPSPAQVLTNQLQDPNAGGSTIG